MRAPLPSLAIAALLALTACNPAGPEANSSDPAAAEQGRNASTIAFVPPPELAPSTAPVAPPGPAAAAPAAPSPEPAAVSARRCGWLHNPTPGNWWLVDGSGEWILGSQGGHQAEGIDEIPDMTRFGWVETNVHYGYGCACMQITLSPGSQTVARVSKVEPLPLARCRADKALPRP